MADRPGERELRKVVHEQTRPLFLHVTTKADGEQCACGLILFEGRLVLKDAETGEIVRCRYCAEGKTVIR